MRILLTGASSYVGAKFYQDLKGHHVVGTFYSNPFFPELHRLDITKRDDVLALAAHVRPEVIIHVAANASSNWCDQHPDMASMINAEGTKNIVDAAKAVHARLIYISSFAAIAPTTLYGRTKRMGEELVKNSTDYVILRPSLIVGYSPNTHNDRPFNRILQNITNGTKAEYDTSWRFQPTWLTHLSDVVQICLEGRIHNETIPVSVPEITSRYELARDILSHFTIIATPVNNRDTSPVFEENLSKLAQLSLPSCTYQAMIEGIVKDIREQVLRK